MSSNWPLYSLSDFINVKHGFAFKGEFFKDEHTTDLLVTPGNFAIGGGFKSDKFKFYEGPVPEGYVLSEGDLIVTMTDLSKQADTLGYSALVPKVADCRLLHNQRVGLVEFKNDELDKTYLYFLLRSKEYRHHVVSTATGSTVKHSSPTKILSFAFRKPPKDIQIDIGKKLIALEEKIELNTQTNQTLEQIAQALFKSWFVDCDPVKAKIAAFAAGGSAEDAELAAISVISAKTVDELNILKASNSEGFNKLAQTAALFPAAMQDSELGEIPEGWEVKQLSEICQVINGRAYKNTEFKTEGTPIVRIQNLSNGGKTVYSDLELPPEKYIDREDFIYAWSATFGPHIWRGPKSIYHYHIWKMEVDESVISRYFLYLSMFRKTEAMKNAGTGSIFTHLTKKIMESQHVLIGDHAINKKFSDIIVPIFDQISSLKNESTHLADIREALLPKLLTGDDLTSEVANV